MYNDAGGGGGGGGGWGGRKGNNNHICKLKEYNSNMEYCIPPGCLQCFAIYSASFLLPDIPCHVGYLYMSDPRQLCLHTWQTFTSSVAALPTTSGAIAIKWFVEGSLAIR